MHCKHFAFLVQKKNKKQEKKNYTYKQLTSKYSKQLEKENTHINEQVTKRWISITKEKNINNK